MRKILSLLFAALMFMAGCTPSEGPDETPSASQGQAKEIYFLNFKPEVSEAYASIAAAYEKETGVRVKVVTASSGMYEATLKSEIAKSAPPTIFQINGPVGLNSWQDYCLDLSDTQLYSLLTDPEMAVSRDGKAYGIPYAVEGYGIIYNDGVMKKYFSLPNRGTEISSAEEIKNFSQLKAVVEDMSLHLEELGIAGVFASTSMSAGNQWRFTTHLANLPFYHEFMDDAPEADPIVTGQAAQSVSFRYAQQYRNLFDLYLSNSVTERGLLGSKSVGDAMAEFALGRCAMVQNGNWADSQILEVQGNTVAAEDIKFLPLYMGFDGEERQGLCIGTENYLCINAKASQGQQQASIAFLEWLFSSPAGKQLVTQELNIIAPFSSFTQDEYPDAPLSVEVAKWMSREDVDTVPWIFQCFPSEAFKDDFGSALLQYSQGNIQWEQVVSTVTERWARERS